MQSAAWDMATLPSNYRLTVDINELVSPERSRKRKSKGRTRVNPPRPKNAFVMFRIDYDARLRRENPMVRAEDVSVWAGREWRNASQEVVEFFRSLEAIARELHNTAYPDYSFPPSMKSSQKPRVRRNKSENATMASNVKARSTSGVEDLSAVLTKASADFPGTTASTLCLTANRTDVATAIGRSEQRTVGIEEVKRDTLSLPIKHGIPDGCSYMLPINVHDDYYSRPQLDYYYAPSTASGGSDDNNNTCFRSNYFATSTNPSGFMTLNHPQQPPVSFQPSSGVESTSDVIPTSNELWYSYEPRYPIE